MLLPPLLCLPKLDFDNYITPEKFEIRYLLKYVLAGASHTYLGVTRSSVKEINSEVLGEKCKKGKALSSQVGGGL